MALAPFKINNIIGQFQEIDHGHYFDYAPSDEQKEFPHLIYVGHNQTRIGKVLKTVAYIVTGENENGFVVEKWQIKNHKIYKSEN